MISIDQSPIGRTPRSNPATYVGLFAPIRTLFSLLPGRQGKGIQVGAVLLQRQGRQVREVPGSGHDPHRDALSPGRLRHLRRLQGPPLQPGNPGGPLQGQEYPRGSRDDGGGGAGLLPAHSLHRPKLATLVDVGLGYVGLGQSALTLSGGEAQRVKLSLELSKRSTGRTFYILDEPTTGLHFADVKKLMEVLQQLVENGNTIALIEHNLDVIKCADWVIDLGPEGGEKGGRIIAEGTPEQVARADGSWTGKYLKRALKRE